MLEGLQTQILNAPVSNNHKILSQVHHTNIFCAWEFQLRK